MTCLLVTGSRSLADSPDARTWARGIIFAAIADESISVVVAGDARGPDEWAITRGFKEGRKVRNFALDGWVHMDDGGSEERAYARKRWADERELAKVAPKRLPLLRNERMVAMVAKHYPEARVIALVDSGSRTQGTMHTVTLARRAGLNVPDECVHTFTPPAHRPSEPVASAHPVAPSRTTRP